MQRNRTKKEISEKPMEEVINSLAGFKLVPYNLNSQMNEDLRNEYNKKVMKKSLGDRREYLFRERFIYILEIGTLFAMNPQLAKLAEYLGPNNIAFGFTGGEILTALWLPAFTITYIKMAISFGEINVPAHLSDKEKDRVERLNKEIIGMVEKCDKKWRDEGHLTDKDPLPHTLRMKNMKKDQKFGGKIFKKVKDWIRK